MSDPVCKYETWHEGKTHVWSCSSPEFAIHVHITDAGERGYGLGRHYGGIEQHSATPPDYMAGSSPSHEHCWLLNGPCWHDGSSLYASEVIIPFWREDPTNNERMFDFIRREYESRK